MSDDNTAYLDAMALMGDGDYDAAIVRFAAALEVQPRRARIHSNLALAACWAGDPAAAMEAARLGRELADKDDPYPALVLAQVYHDADRYEEAVQAADDALATEDLSASHASDALQHKGWSLLALDRWREGLAAADEALDLERGDADIWSLKASCLAEGNRWGEALEAIDSAVALDPEDDELGRRRGLIKTGLNTIAESLDDARAAAEGSDDWEAWHELGTVLTALGRLEEAVTAFDRARELHPDDVYRSDAPAMLSPWEADCRLALLAKAAG